MKRFRHQRRGMSLVEVMVVIAIILTLMAILGGIAIAVYQKAKVSTTKLQVVGIGQAIDLYSIVNPAPPGSDGIDVVYADLGQPSPEDAWGNDFIYTPPSAKSYDVLSYGSDGIEAGSGNAEDIRLSELRRQE